MAKKKNEYAVAKNEGVFANSNGLYGQFNSFGGGTSSVGTYSDGLKLQNSELPFQNPNPQWNGGTYSSGSEVGNGGGGTKDYIDDGSGTVVNGTLANPKTVNPQTGESEGGAVSGSIAPVPPSESEPTPDTPTPSTPTPPVEDSTGGEVPPQTDNVTGESEPTTTDTSEKKEEKLTYEDYIALMKQSYDDYLAQAKHDTEIARERALANAQNSYAQNRATYGANAEKLAQMGLTGGGYGDYLNAQAYAQKRADVQGAYAQEYTANATAQKTYSDYISQMNAQLAEKALYDERLEDQRLYEQEQNRIAEEKEKTEQTKTNYTSILSTVQTSPDSYTEDGIRSICASLGLDEAQTQEVIKSWNSALTASDEKTNKNSYDTILRDVQNNPNGYNETGLRSICKSNGFTEEQTQVVVEAWKSGSDGMSIDGEEEDALESVEYDEVYIYESALKDIGTYGSDYDFSTIDAYYEKGLITQDYYYDCVKRYNDMCIEDGKAYNMNTSAIDKAYEDKAISEEDYEKYKAYWNMKFDVESVFYNGESKKTYSEGKKLYEQFSAHSWMTEETKKALEDSFYKEYAQNIAQAYDKNIKENAWFFDIDAEHDFTAWGNFLDVKKEGSKQWNYLKQIEDDYKAGKIQVGQVLIANYGAVADSQSYYVYIGNGIFVKGSWEGFTHGSRYVPEGYWEHQGVNSTEWHISSR